MALFHGSHKGSGDGGAVEISPLDSGNFGCHFIRASASPSSCFFEDPPLDGTPLLRQDPEFALRPSCTVAPCSSPLSGYMGSPPENPTLWRPGSDSIPPFREPMDRLQTKQELQRLYEQVCESAYDLSLRDIVDPSYSISGHLKAVVAESELSGSSEQEKHVKSSRKTDSKGLSFRRKLLFSFSFPGVNVKRDSRDSIPTSTVRTARRQLRRPSHGEARSNVEPLSASDHNWKPSFKRSASADRLESKSNPHLDRRTAYNQGSSSVSKVHPSNQCASCSSYTLFFKSRCQVCGKFYCSSCAKDAMDTMSNGRKCKATCNSHPSSRRFTRKVGKSCLPFCITASA